MNCLVFDIETVPDTAFGREHYELGDLTDAEVAAAMQFKQLQKSGTEFLPLHLHRVVAISAVMRRGTTLNVWSLGDIDADEPELVQRFFDGIERYSPTLVSWNGGGFDLPVLHYRALRHGIAAPRYWEVGDNETAFRYNNYLGRFHWRHVDLMDVLAGYQPRARASLDEVASMLGYPGKHGMSGGDVWPAYQEGRIAEIRHYCETDVLNTYLVYLAFEAMRGVIDDVERDREIERVRAWLAESNEPHFKDFLGAWGH
ncbi:MAG: 3'-5' exonuclease [Pseudomonadota bacterium]